MVPVPVRLMIWSELESLSTMVMVPVQVPTAVGMNLALYLQLAPGARVPPGLTQEPSPPKAKSPVMESEAKVKEALPVLVRVAYMTALVVPTVTLPKLRVMGEMLIKGPET